MGAAGHAAAHVGGAGTHPTQHVQALDHGAVAHHPRGVDVLARGAHFLRLGRGQLRDRTPQCRANALFEFGVQWHGDHPKTLWRRTATADHPKAFRVRVGFTIPNSLPRRPAHPRPPRAPSRSFLVSLTLFLYVGWRALRCVQQELRALRTRSSSPALFPTLMDTNPCEAAPPESLPTSGHDCCEKDAGTALSKQLTGPLLQLNLVVGATAAAMLVGRKGANVRSLESETGTTIRILFEYTPIVDARERVVTVRGPDTGLRAVAARVARVVLGVCARMPPSRASAPRFYVYPPVSFRLVCLTWRVALPCAHAAL